MTVQSKSWSQHIIAEHGCGTLIMMLNFDALCFIELKFDSKSIILKKKGV